MAEPKKRMTQTRSGNRQSHDALKSRALYACPNCKAAVLPHTVCKNCGFYKGKKVMSLKSDVKAEKKIKEELKDE